MNVFIVSTNRNRHPVPVMPIGACIVAEAAERAGHRVRLLDLMFCRDTEDALVYELAAFKPDVVGLSIRNIDNNDMQNPIAFFEEQVPLVDVIRSKTQAAIVLGGSGVSVMPGELLRYTGAAWAVTGDGETVFPKLLNALQTGKGMDLVSGVVSDYGFRSNSYLAPYSSTGCVVPDFNRWLDVGDYLSHLSTAPVQSKRGCPYKCIYCTYPINEGEAYRLCPPESVVDAIGGYVSEGLRNIEFVDNVFNSPYDHAMDICQALAHARTGAHLLSLELNPRFVDDALLSAMEAAGFVGIGISAESASGAVLDRLGKGFTSREVYNAAYAVGRHDLPCLWIFMLGAPGETQKTVRETLRFAESCIRPRDIAFFNVGVRIYPGTELERLAREEGVLNISCEEMLAPVFYLSPEIGLGWLINELHDAMASHMNFIGPDALSLSYLPFINRIGYRLGVKPPLWKYTPFIRRGLRLFGADV